MKIKFSKFWILVSITLIIYFILDLFISQNPNYEYLFSKFKIHYIFLFIICCLIMDRDKKLTYLSILDSSFRNIFIVITILAYINFILPKELPWLIKMKLDNNDIKTYLSTLMTVFSIIFTVLFGVFSTIRIKNNQMIILMKNSSFHGLYALLTCMIIYFFISFIDDITFNNIKINNFIVFLIQLITFQFFAYLLTIRKIINLVFTTKNS